MVLLHLVALLIGGLSAPRDDDPAAARVPPAHVADGATAASGPGPSGADSTGVAVIVHDPGTGDALEPSQIRRVFLLRQRFWSDGSPVAPVNLPARSPLRERFSQLVLGQSTRELAEYWKDLYFHGTQPPPVLDSEEAVLLYVSRTPGGIGYVSLAFLDSAALPASVRVAAVWDTGG